MKRLFYLMVAVIITMTATNCKRGASFEAIVEPDVFFFLLYDSTGDSVEEHYCCTEMTVEEGSQTEFLYVGRNSFVAYHNPEQSVDIVVDETLSTAEKGVDFTIDPESIRFEDEDNWVQSLNVSVNSNTAGKKIVLRLVYDYYDYYHPIEGRKYDTMTINIE